MNKYLLLRDNKQSGPYTVPEIIAMGIKPYDLVWLEGKSAAWRYPSEVEELKAYAPAVEEQPFDRFYKKPVHTTETANPQKVLTAAAADAVQAPVVEVVHPVHEEKHEAYKPQIHVRSGEEKNTKKVYINFPAASIPAASPTPEKTTPATTHTTAPVMEAVKDPIYQREISSCPPRSIDNESPVINSGHGYGHPKGNSHDKRMLQVAVAACLLLGLISGVLVFNYFRQQKTLQELNTLVQQIENTRKEQQAVTAAQQEQSTAPLPTESVVNDEPIVTPPADPVMPATQSAGNQRATPPAARKKAEPAPENISVVLQQGRPVQRRDDPAPPAEEPAPISNDNLFRLVDVRPNDYKTGLLGGISNLKFELTNNSSVELHRVAVEVKYLGPEKKVVKRHTVYFENVQPGANSTIDVPKSNRGVSIEYTITDIKS